MQLNPLPTGALLRCCASGCAGLLPGPAICSQPPLTLPTPLTLLSALPNLGLPAQPNNVRSLFLASSPPFRHTRLTWVTRVSQHIVSTIDSRSMAAFSLTQLTVLGLQIKFTCDSEIS